MRNGFEMFWFVFLLILRKYGLEWIIKIYGQDFAILVGGVMYMNQVYTNICYEN